MRSATARLLLVAAFLSAPSATTREASAQRVEPGGVAFWAPAGAALATAWTFDRELRDLVRSEPSPLRDRLASLGDEAGARRNIVPALGGALVVSHLTDWPAPSERILNAAAGVAVAAVLTEGLKVVAGRPRPRAVEEPRTFRPFESGWRSMPSGHASASFSLVAALGREFGLPGAVEGAGYLVGGLVAWSRVHDDAHWPSDVVAGAVLGVVAAKTTVSHLKRRQASEGDRPSDGGGLGIPVSIPVILVRIPLP